MKLLNQYIENKTSTNSVSQVLVKFCLCTVDREPTLSAERKVSAKSIDFAAYRLSIC
jgi:hypothetical protein